MRKLLKSYRTELHPTLEQAEKINRTIGVCRYVYNFYLAHNRQVYKDEHRFVTGYDFQKWLHHVFLPNHPDFQWIKEVSSKSVKQSILNADKAFRRFFERKSGFPRFKKKGVSDPSMYFVRTDARTVIPCERHRIKIPTLGWVRLKEKGYIPTDRTIRSGCVSRRAGHYYVSVVVEVLEPEKPQWNDNGIGIDLGIKNFAVVSDGTVYGNINRSKVIRKTEKKLKREQRRLSRKYESLKQRTKTMKGEATRQNIQKQLWKVQRLHQRLERIRTDYIQKTIRETVKTKLSYIVLEDLNVRGMMKNRHLSKAIASQKFYAFRTKLTAKCRKLGMEPRIADRFYPSSKMCYQCGQIKTDWKLSDREYVCDGGYRADRDFNASLNLRDMEVYTVA